MLPSPTRTERLTSLKGNSIGDMLEVKWMERIQRILVKDSLVFLIMLMLPWFGVEMERSTSLKVKYGPANLIKGYCLSIYLEEILDWSSEQNVVFSLF